MITKVLMSFDEQQKSPGDGLTAVGRSSDDESGWETKIDII